MGSNIMDFPSVRDALPNQIALVGAVFNDNTKVDYMSNTSHRTGLNKWILVLCKILMIPEFMISDIWSTRNPYGNALFALYFGVIGAAIYSFITGCILTTHSKDNLFLINGIMAWYATLVFIFLIS